MRDTYVPNFKVPGSKKPSAKMWVTILLCIALPPIGMALMWGKTNCPIRGKVFMTFVSVAVMVTVITLMLIYGKGANDVSDIYSNVAATPGVSQSVVQPSELAPQAESGDGTVMQNPAAGIPETQNDSKTVPDDSQGVIPANPVS